MDRKAEIPCGYSTNPPISVQLFIFDTRFSRKSKSIYMFSNSSSDYCILVFIKQHQIKDTIDCLYISTSNHCQLVQ